MTVVAAHVTVEPHGIREKHWHPSADEWSFFMRGRARTIILASSSIARTFDYMPGDVGIVPTSMDPRKFGEELAVKKMPVNPAPKRASSAP